MQENQEYLVTKFVTRLDSFHVGFMDVSCSELYFCLGKPSYPFVQFVASRSSMSGIPLSKTMNEKLRIRSCFNVFVAESVKFRYVFFRTGFVITLEKYISDRQSSELGSGPPGKGSIAEQR